MTQLFDLGEPVAVSKPSGPMKESFIVAAFFPQSGEYEGYWRIWKDLWHTKEAAIEAAGKLPACWAERRIYRIPGDQP